ncbi:hypothetical protein [Endozoicomonas sp. GU-1]|uniref:hypothetical protein n=1 Tax=Endozoicomonas sp. GU-1 TaxID=3009078 RepID=UPI0022B3CC5B|nr:hypothetical protein [Endozoicomonas sp. GU-1]WBA82900.1 hypothetical protein O2T12_07190 [Endozoicomonas sp. GU-1]WBA85827.1 hypothetical protein O3276_21830 [Endozoicomonas sp. GU-1]
MYAFGSRTMVGGLAIPVFLATGIAPFLYFKKVISQSLGAVTANQNLFLFRQMRVFDAFLVRFLLEMATQILSRYCWLTAPWPKTRITMAVQLSTLLLVMVTQI